MGYITVENSFTTSTLQHQISSMLKCSGPIANFAYTHHYVFEPTTSWWPALVSTFRPEQQHALFFFYFNNYIDQVGFFG